MDPSRAVFAAAPVPPSCACGRPKPRFFFCSYFILSCSAVSFYLIINSSRRISFSTSAQPLRHCCRLALTQKLLSCSLEAFRVSRSQAPPPPQPLTESTPRPPLWESRERRPSRTGRNRAQCRLCQQFASQRPSSYINRLGPGGYFAHYQRGFFSSSPIRVEKEADESTLRNTHCEDSFEQRILVSNNASTSAFVSHLVATGFSHRQGNLIT